MAVTVSGTSITFNDATVQTTAASAPTTTQVLNATAGASAGAVGTYAWVYKAAGPMVFGTNYAGSGLLSAGFYWDGATLTPSWVTTLSGTWKCMGSATGGGYTVLVLALRVA